MNKIILLNLVKSLALSIFIFGMAVFVAIGVEFLADSYPSVFNPGTVILCITFALLWMSMYAITKKNK